MFNVTDNHLEGLGTAVKVELQDRGYPEAKFYRHYTQILARSEKFTFKVGKVRESQVVTSESELTSLDPDNEFTNGSAFLRILFSAEYTLENGESYREDIFEMQCRLWGHYSWDDMEIKDL